MEENETPETNDTSGSDALFNTVVAIAVAFIALVGSLITKVQGDATTFSGIAASNEQMYYYQAMGDQISGDANINNEFGTIFQLWREYDLLAVSAEKSGDVASAQAYRELRDSLVNDSALLSSQYFNPATGNVDVPAFKMETYGLDIIELEEKQQAASEVSAAWDDKASVYVLQMTMLAVAGFLLGLALMTKSHVPRLIFAGSGIPMVVVVSIWSYVVWLDPIYDLRETGAIPYYAQGASFVKQKEWEAALPALDEAIKFAGEEYPYGRAYLLRADANAALGNFEAAIQDYEIAIDAGEVAPNIVSDLVWVFFQMGRFDDALEAGEVALEENPEDLWLQLRMAMVELGTGDVSTARLNYRLTLNRAAESARQKRSLGADPSEIWWQINEASYQLKTLAALLADETAVSPVKDAISDPALVGQAAAEMAILLDEKSVAIQYEIEEGSINAAISKPKFVVSINESKGFVYKVGSEFQYSGLEEGSLLVVKVSRNGVEDPSWTRTLNWNRANEGVLKILLTPAYADLYIVQPGVYEVSFYVNGVLTQHGQFMVGNDTPQPGASFEFSDMLDGFDFFNMDIFETENDEDGQEYDIQGVYEDLDVLDFEELGNNVQGEDGFAGFEDGSMIDDPSGDSTDLDETTPDDGDSTTDDQSDPETGDATDGGSSEEEGGDPPPDEGG
ncbi:MAG: hypothetical protein IPG80_11960 [Anaerolineales bacterium]|uniref:tetratricopeptide repeat protein n=1 Tax=Candidatus Villigracilis vicinus TaxID=3140679 RepID=UPI003135B250|nr:hypothetical protein [Anaerolineales bacterium]